MKILTLATISLAAAAFGASPAMAATWAHHHADVIARNAEGRATMVRVNGTDYKVCSRSVTDDCINPRQAGLGWGDQPLNRWPAKSASDADHG